MISTRKIYLKRHSMNALTIYKNLKTILTGFWQRQAIERKKADVSEAVPFARRDVVLSVGSNTLFHFCKWTPTGIFYVDAEFDLSTLAFDSRLDNEHEVFGGAWKRLA